MNNSTRKDRRNLLYSIIVASFIPMIVFPLIYLTNGFFVLPDDLLVIVGSWLGLIAFMFIFWQYALGVKAITSRFTDDIIVTNKLHQTFGIYGFFLILAHPVIIFFGYLLVNGENLINLRLSTPLDIATKIGLVALILIIFNWFVSYLFRKNFSFRWWKRLHLLNYSILPLVYLHAHDIGSFLQDPMLDIYFKLLSGIFGLIFLYRLGKQLGFFKYKYVVSALKEVTHDVIEVSFAPVKAGRTIIPQPGQFIEIQTSQWGETHPFTVLDFDASTNTISIAPKDSGKFSSELTKLKVGDLVLLDGPYGVFTKQAYKPENKKLVFIVGGIGITPFLRFLDFFKNNSQNYQEVGFFYGNKTPDDIAFKQKLDELKQFSNFKEVDILSGYEGDDPQFEKGYVSSDVMKKYLKEVLSSYKFFICGPPIMMDKVSADLISKGVPAKQIYMEKFSW